MKINNLPADYNEYKYLTLRNVNGEWWFYGAWSNSLEKARKQANEINGIVVSSEEIERT